MTFRTPYSLSAAKRNYRCTWSKRPDSHLAICRRDRLVGHIYYDRQVDILRKSTSIGYWLGEEYWGQGVTTASIRATSDFIFEATDIVRIFARAFANNHGSIRALEKAGYEREGYFRSAVLKEERLIDQVQYARVKSVE